MAVSIKSAREIELMRESCRLLEIVHDELGKAIRPGISTLDIDRMGEKMIRDMGCGIDCGKCATKETWNRLWDLTRDAVRDVSIAQIKELAERKQRIGGGEE